MSKRLSMKEVMNILSVTRKTVYNYVERGFLRYNKNEINGGISFDEVEVKEFLKRLRK